MSKFLKFSIVSFALILLLHTVVSACWNGVEHEKSNFRFWLFQPDLMPWGTVRILSYPDFETDYNDFISKDISLRQRSNKDTAFYAQNIAEWQAALAGDPSVKSAKSVVSKDIHTVLYRLDPEDFFRKMDGDSLGQNTFISAIKSSKSLLNYLNYAKICEQLMNFMDPWVAYSDGKDRLALLRYAKMGDSVIQQKNTSPFVRERTAYQLIKMAHYLDDTARVLSLYHQFFEKTGSKSWVVGSASFYYAVAHKDAFLQNYLLSKTFENSVDKRWLSLRYFDESDSILRGSLALARNAHERAVQLTLPVLTNQGRTLKALKNIYAIDPQNSLFQIAIQREINKLEDWIYTNKFTEYATSSDDINVENDYELAQKRRASGLSQRDIDAQNLRSDVQYMNETALFVNQIVAERKQPNPAFWQLAAAHLAFLKKDFAAAKRYLAKAKTEKNTPLSMETQIWLTDLLCDLYSAPHLGADDEAAILKFDDFLKKQKNNLVDYESFRSQIMRLLSDRFIADGKTAKGILILSKSTLTFGAIHDSWEKNFYHKLLETGTPQDFEEAIDIVSRKSRSALTPFERWLASEPKSYEAPHGLRYYYDDEEKKEPQAWNVSKLKDYESMIYVNQDKLDSALQVLQSVPDKFWRDYPFAEYMTENPFTPALDYRARSAANYDDGWEHVTYPTAKYTKPQFLKRLIELKNQLASDPVTYEKNYFLIGTAYFNMTNYGKFWLMSQIFWDGVEVEKRTDFNNNFYGCQRASAWFADGVAHCKNEQLAAMCCFSANMCQKNRDLYEFELMYHNNYDTRPDMKETKTPLWRNLRKRFRGAQQYEDMDYWCTNLDRLVETFK